MKENIMDLNSALTYAKDNRIEDWVHEFLLGEGNNKGFSEGLKLFERFYYGPIKMKLDLFERCCGPEDKMKYKVDKKAFDQSIHRMSQEILNGWQAPPIIINYEDGIFELNDGNHRFEAFLMAGIEEYYVIIWTTQEKDMLDFQNKYLV